MSRGSALAGWIVAAAAPLLAGCVSSGAYEAAMVEAQTARVEAVRREAEVRALETTIASLSRRLDAQEASSGEVRSSLELVRSLRSLGLLDGRVADQIRRACAASPTPPDSPSNADVPRAAPTRPAAPPPDPRRSKKPQIAANRPLDRDDPWGPRPAPALTLSKAGAGPALDGDDPWRPARPPKAPPLDAADPW